MSSTPHILSRNGSTCAPLASIESIKDLDESLNASQNSAPSSKPPVNHQHHHHHLIKKASIASLTNSTINKTAQEVDSSAAAAAAAVAAASPTGANASSSKVNTIDPDFEYKGYHKFGRILGKGSFGTVIECARKCDEQAIALKLFKFNAIHKWIPEQLVAEDMRAELRANSEFFAHVPPPPPPAPVRDSSSSSGTETNSSDEDQLNEQAEESGARSLPSEVACLIRASGIPGVVKILDYIPESSVEHDLCDSTDESIIGIVLERHPDEICLFEYLLQNKFLHESEARVIMRQLVQICIDLLHAGVLHGDLKSENILINPKTKRIKVIDFGSAQLIDTNNSNSRVSHHHQHHHQHHHHQSHHGHGHQHSHGGHSNGHSSHHGHHHSKCKSQSQNIAKPFRTFRGTNLYKPPEYILHHCFYPRASTVWSFGIILYDMVCGNFPFDKDSDILTHQDKEIEFSRPNLSESLEDLVRKCLSFYVCDRINIEKILNHPWLNEDDSK
jgi:serine/threonine protein kinase